MALIDDVKTALEQINQAKAQMLDSYGGNAPGQLTEQFQNMQGNITRDMEWVQKLSDQEEGAKAKLQAQLQAEANGPKPEPQEEIDWEAYPWKFQEEHEPEPARVPGLIQSLLHMVQPPAPAQTQVSARRPEEAPIWDSLYLP